MIHDSPAKAVFEGSIANYLGLQNKKSDLYNVFFDDRGWVNASFDRSINTTDEIASFQSKDVLYVFTHLAKLAVLYAGEYNSPVYPNVRQFKIQRLRRDASPLSTTELVFKARFKEPAENSRHGCYVVCRLESKAVELVIIAEFYLDLEHGVDNQSDALITSEQLEELRQQTLFYRTPNAVGEQKAEDDVFPVSVPLTSALMDIAIHDRHGEAKLVLDKFRQTFENNVSQEIVANYVCNALINLSSRLAAARLAKRHYKYTVVFWSVTIHDMNSETVWIDLEAEHLAREGGIDTFRCQASAAGHALLTMEISHQLLV